MSTNQLIVCTPSILEHFPSTSSLACRTYVYIPVIYWLWTWGKNQAIFLMPKSGTKFHSMWKYFVALDRWFMSQDAARWLGGRRRLPGTSISRLGWLRVALTSWCPTFLLKMHLLLVTEWHFLVMEVFGVSIKLEWSCTMFNGSVTYIMSLVQRLPFDLVLGIYSSIPIWSKHHNIRTVFFFSTLFQDTCGTQTHGSPVIRPRFVVPFGAGTRQNISSLTCCLLCKAASRA